LTFLRGCQLNKSNKPWRHFLEAYIMNQIYLTKYFYCQFMTLSWALKNNLQFSRMNKCFGLFFWKVDIFKKLAHFHLFTLPLEFRNNKTSRNHFRWIGFWPLSTQLENWQLSVFKKGKKQTPLMGIRKAGVWIISNCRNLFCPLDLRYWDHWTQHVSSLKSESHTERGKADPFYSVHCMK
jgi:hypothetical protein